ncbi:MAG: alpha/beta hydrolase [Myxococcales bacterium]|nr:alpha/beta hydrolase [Myxococcales bacterium]
MATRIDRPLTPRTAAPLQTRPAPAAAPQAPAAAPAKATGWAPKTAARPNPFERLKDKLTPEPFRQGPGPKIDPFNASKDWMSDRVFNKLRPNGPPEKLTGPQRVAYGPLDAPPTLKRPVVMIPGLTMPAQSFDKLGDQLATNKANGPVIVYVASQDTFRLGDAQGREVTGAELKNAKLFQLEYKDPWASPTLKAPQIARAMERIASATKQPGLDVVAHSAGGTDFRLYLDQRDASKGPKVERAVLIGPASHGTYVGNIGGVVGNPVKNVDDAARELAVGSKLIGDLNTNWERQRSQVAGGVTIVGTSGTPTLGPKKGLFEDGDGYMPTAGLAMPGAKTVVMEGPHNSPLAHLWQVQYSGVVNSAMGVLGR